MTFLVMKNNRFTSISKTRIVNIFFVILIKVENLDFNFRHVFKMFTIDVSHDFDKYCAISLKFLFAL